MSDIFEPTSLALRDETTLQPRENQQMHNMENETEALLRREGATFVGLTPEQITDYHHFDAFQDELSREVKLTAAIRLALVDSNPEFSLLLSRTRLTKLREQSLCEIANDGIAQTLARIVATI